MSIERIDQLIDQLVAQRILVAELELALANARADAAKTEFLIADTVGEYDAKWQYVEAKENAIASSEEVAQARLRITEAQRELVTHKAHLKGIEERISLYRAWLYGHAQMPQ